MTELDVKKMVKNKPSVKRLELEYKGENYIIINFEAKVIDVNGDLWEYSVDDDKSMVIHNLIWNFEEIYSHSTGDGSAALFGERCDRRGGYTRRLL